MTVLVVRGRSITPFLSQTRRRRPSTIWLAFAGALAYCSWPLAFLVNPSLAGNGLASSFEAPGQRFSWLFILLDCIAGSCIVVVCIRAVRSHHRLLKQRRALAFVLLGYATFGLATAVDALVPLRCGSRSVQACASQVWPLTPDDLLTAAAMASLCLAAVTLAVHMMRRVPAVQCAVPATVAVTLIGWFALGLVVVLDSPSVTVAADSQYAFLTLTSVLALVVPLGAISVGRPYAANIGRTAGPVLASANRLIKEPGGADAEISRRNRRVIGQKAIEPTACAHLAAQCTKSSLAFHERRAIRTQDDDTRSSCWHVRRRRPRPSTVHA